MARDGRLVRMTAPESDTAIASLLATLRGAFPDDIFAGPVTADVGPEDEDREEELTLGSELAGKKWSEVPAALVKVYPDGMALLTDQAFAAFLPAWLAVALGDGEVREMLAYHFSPAVHGPSERSDRRIRQLTPSQREALIAFFAHCADVEHSKFVKAHAQHALRYVMGLR